MPTFWRPLAVALTVCLAACGPTGGLRAPEGVAPGTDRRGQSVDGLTVGHRLAEAGEFELALRAYYRAAGEQGINADVLSAIGSTNLKLGRLGQAEQMLRRALELDPDFVPALNNLGVVLMEKGETGEARRVFQRAYALDSGNSDAIRENLRLAIARTENRVYDPPNEANFSLVRRGQGEYLLLSH
ncbi:tetratricopeptide repeat protein [Gemmobacter sp.]|uniref:tetratricopeptide repeat protein n=1 Tax=Gemmobacter sp. TaxID=1898957 RepID=UPI002AFF985D|nr:tetratricopeptide repeat protein [Gemmobacter sp.]